MLMMPLALILSANLTQAPAPTPALASLVAAEYGFADQVEKQGIRTGFMSNLRNDSMVFIPRAVSGIAYYKTQLEMGALLKWAPSVAEVSQAADLGYTTAPWTYQMGKDEPVNANGWFVTLWQREGNGPWKVRLDIGIPTPDPSERPAPARLARPATAALPTMGAGQSNPEELMELDRTFSKDAAKDPAKAYTARIDNNVRFYRKGRFPVEGAKALATALDPGAVSWVPTEAFMSASGDLGCTRGTLQHPDGASNYVRMWKKQGAAWKLVLDLELALPVKK